MTNHLKNNFEIDAVIAWVDGNDEKHKKKLAQYIEDKSLLKSKGFLTRFNEVNEIEYCVKSIRKFAPYIRTIYIVTDEQTPSFLKDNLDKSEFHDIKIIDHKDIFKGYLEYLPTFNCYPIETLLFRIPNLAEHFIYFNDDMFLINETKSTDFFTSDGFPILRGKWAAIENSGFKDFLKSIGLKKKRISKITYKKAHENSSKILGIKKYFKLNHTPFPIRKSVFSDYFSKNETILRDNIRHRFRVPTFFMVQAHAAHLEILNQTYLSKKEYSLVHFGSTEKSLSIIKWKLFWGQKRLKKLFLNIQNLDMYSEKKLNYILNWFNDLYK
ncbi:stealth family protein [Flavobacterium paronense]|uniref:Stealth family protein n=1 Tax=Flavobacterium paronense TaxID=1392775 RepID=A0ABV5GDB2_9FLAO|nr:stealth family protein [Flavobacterium paronense]MDN3677521.1 stealth family protein [Flavobacterium paronense]